MKTRMKKMISMLLALTMVSALCACSVETVPAEDEGEEANEEVNEETSTEGTEITLWTYPIGNWGDQATVDALMADFEEETGIKVTVEYLTYTDGDDKVNTAIEAGAAPDLIMEGGRSVLLPTGAQRARWWTFLI